MNIHDHIKQAAESVLLSKDERSRMRHVVHEYMAMKPLPAPEYSVSIQWFSLSWIQRPLAAALALVFIFGSGVSFAAEGALPGDALYSVKTKVNESVKVALATNAEAKANVQIELAERRIEEAAVLAAENRLDADTQIALAAAFESHASEATREVEAIDEEDSSAAAEISSRFETRLAAHEAVLSLVSSNADATNTLAAKIRGTGLAVADIRARAEERMAVSAPVVAATLSLAMDTADDPAVTTMAMKVAVPAPQERTSQVESANVATTNEGEVKYDTRAAERMRGSAETQLKAAQKKLKAAKVDAEVKAEAEAQLTLAEDNIEEGRVFLKDKAAAHAYHSFQAGLMISEKLNVMLKAESSLKKAGVRAANAPTSNTRTKANTARPDIRNTTNTSAAPAATLHATGSPINIDVGVDAEVIHEVVPVIPPSVKIFVPKINIDTSTGGGLNIGL